MILDAFDVEEVSIWSPKNLGGVYCHVERRRRIMLESWVEPPLAEKYVHGVVLFLKKRKVSFINIIDRIVYWLDWTLTSILLITKWWITRRTSNWKHRRTGTFGIGVEAGLGEAVIFLPKEYV